MYEKYFPLARDLYDIESTHDYVRHHFSWFEIQIEIIIKFLKSPLEPLDN